MPGANEDKPKVEIWNNLSRVNWGGSPRFDPGSYRQPLKISITSTENVPLVYKLVSGAGLPTSCVVPSLGSAQMQTASGNGGQPKTTMGDN